MSVEDLLREGKLEQVEKDVAAARVGLHEAGLHATAAQTIAELDRTVRSNSRTTRLGRLSSHTSGHPACGSERARVPTSPRDVPFVTL